MKLYVKKSFQKLQILNYSRSLISQSYNGDPFTKHNIYLK